MPSSRNPLAQAISDMEAAQISVEPLESKFVTAITSVMPKEGEKKDQASYLSSGFERLLQRHHDDSRLIVSTSTALGEASDHELPAFISKLSRFTKYMEAPVAAHSVKTIKMANFVHLHPEILEIKHIDSIQTLSRLPEGVVTKGLKKGEIQVGGSAIRIARADPKEIADAVKKVKEAAAEVRKQEKAERIELAKQEHQEEENRTNLFSLDDASDPFENEDQQEMAIENDRVVTEERDEDSLKPQLSEAASALTKVLGSLSRNKTHPELSHVLAEARKLLMLAMRDSDYVLDPAGSDVSESTGDFH